MLFERIVSEGLAHYSYIIGDKADAIVIDPRRDCEVYIENAYKQGMKIAYILETHRNEDYLIGSVELSARTGAEIWHADSQWDYKYGKPVQEGQTWKIGRLSIKAVHTPGHTPGMMNYLLHDSDGMPWIVFTGDTLFAGEVGRIDLLGMDKAPEMAGLIYDSIFDKLLPLGDEVLVCPAHGAGSVCGESIAERLWTTIGIERMHNPRLQYKSRDEFVAGLLKSQPERPPYFTRMETLNLEGAPILGRLPLPSPVSAGEFEDLAKQAFILDTRMELSFASGHVPGAQSIWHDGLASFEGWFVPYDRPVLLVNETNDTKEVTRILTREGYDNLAGALSGDMLSWHMSGLGSASIKTITVQELYMLMGGGEPILVLDVRSHEELSKDGSMPGALHIHITQLPERLNEVPRKKPIYVFCGSGLRSMIGASFLQRNGWTDLTVILGGMSAWKSMKHQTKK
ncbi:MAG TPA: MBL fold metallo-hydrolase [Methanotrichaceae archaeon]|nr:MBL fold metallo-hydrolase [Methanotrichaceae archaeon]